MTFGTVTPADFDLPNSPAIDSNSNAVIVANTGSVEFVGNKKSNWISYVYKKNIRIKILNKKAYDLATVKIRLWGEDDEQDKLEDVNASTYNLDNGKVSETRLSISEIFDEKIRKSLDEKRFTMPDVKDGSIIEYSYKITSLHYYYLPAWNFQFLQYPCLFSDFKIGFPDLVRFLQIRYGLDSFYSVTSKDSYTTLIMANLNVGTTIHNHEWIMKNIPAFKNEDYISEPRNYL
ncbi:MAG: DUF3857 domain-containing protein, partial [Ginsengibacter sp.]